MSQPIPNLPHFPIDPGSSAQTFELIRNELELLGRSVADNQAVLQGLEDIRVSLRILRVTGSPVTGWYNTRIQQQKIDALFNPSLAFSPAAVWEDVQSQDDSFLVDANPSSAIATGSYVASWFQLYNINNVPTFLLMAGAGGALPVPQYQYQVLQAVAQRQTGFDWPRLHPPV